MPSCFRGSALELLALIPKRLPLRECLTARPTTCTPTYELLGHLGDLHAVADYRHDGFMLLFHLAHLQEHSATSRVNNARMGVQGVGYQPNTWSVIK